MGKKKSCKHEWRFSYINYKYPVGVSGTGGDPDEYAYFLCNKCLMVIKRKVITKGNIKN